ncbi:hypothetical protein NX059_012060 [Plenodomus lindquistii]|nr:hypothetical protein NX059_012060 [Plenodomus lindquistii]
MPFRDQEDEDLSRDCATFPAYTDYLYGPDRRLDFYREQDVIFPHTPQQPIRYTNSTPSRLQPFITENQESRLASMDVRYSTDGHSVERLAPQFVKSLYMPDANSHVLLNESRRRLQDLVLAQLATPTPSRRQPLQTLTTPISLQSSQQRVTRPSLLQSSSATDVDDDLASRARGKQPILVSNASSSTQQSLSLDYQMHIDEEGKPAYTIPALVNGTGGPISVLRPGDVLGLQYVFIPAELREKINERLITVWANLVDPATREAALRSIFRHSRQVHQYRQQWEQSQQQQHLERMQPLEQQRAQESQPEDHLQIPQQGPTSSFDDLIRPFTQLQFERTMKADNSTLQDFVMTDALRENINRILPCAFEALRMRNSENLTERDDAVMRLNIIKMALPVEGRQYFQEGLAKMKHEMDRGSLPSEATSHHPWAN